MICTSSQIAVGQFGDWEWDGKSFDPMGDQGNRYRVFVGKIWNWKI